MHRAEQRVSKGRNDGTKRDRKIREKREHRGRKYTEREGKSKEREKEAEESTERKMKYKRSTKERP